MGLGWYFSDEYSPSDELVDKLADSKFGMDRWTSFSREIIQNSLDACDDESIPVEVIFDLNTNLTINDIPGGLYTREVLSKCTTQATNRQTKQSYQKGMEILEKPSVSPKDEKTFFKLIKAAFAQRRKTLVNALSSSGAFGSKEEIGKAIEELNLSPTVRGEALSIEQFCALSDYFTK